MGDFDIGVSISMNSVRWTTSGQQLRTAKQPARMHA